MITNTNHLQQKLVHGLFSLFATLCIVYCCILVAIVFSVIERKQVNLASTDLTNQLMQAENHYATEVASIDETTIQAKGFHRFDATSFAVRKDPIATYAVLYAH